MVIVLSVMLARYGQDLNNSAASISLMSEQMTGQESTARRDTPLERIFYLPATSTVLDFFILNQNLLSTESEISRLTQVPPRTLQRVLPLLLKERLIKRERK